MVPGDLRQRVVEIEDLEVLLERGDLAVHVSPNVVADDRVREPLDARAGEAEIVAVARGGVAGSQQAEVHRPVGQLRCPPLVDVEDAVEERDAEPAADDRRLLQGVAGLLVEVGEVLLEQLVEVSRQGEVAVAIQAPGGAVCDDDAAHGEHHQHLLHQQRAAAGHLVHPASQLGGEVVPLEARVDHAAHPVGVEGAELHGADGGPASGEPLEVGEGAGVVASRPLALPGDRGEHRHAGAARVLAIVPQQEGERLERGGVGELKIVEEQAESLLAAEEAESLEGHGEEARPPALVLVLGVRLDDRAQRRHPSRQHTPVVRPQEIHQRGRRLGVHLEQRAHELGEHGVGGGADLFAAGDPQGQVAGLGAPELHLAQEAGLAHPALAAQEQQRGGPALAEVAQGLAAGELEASAHKPRAREPTEEVRHHGSMRRPIAGEADAVEAVLPHHPEGPLGRVKHLLDRRAVFGGLREPRREAQLHAGGVSAAAGRVRDRVGIPAELAP